MSSSKFNHEQATPISLPLTATTGRINIGHSEVFVKKDRTDKAIIEFLASGMMHFFAKKMGMEQNEDPNPITFISFAVPDNSNSVHIVSPIMHNARDLYQDLILSIQIPDSRYEKARSTISKKWPKLSAKRPSFFNNELVFESMLASGRGKNYIAGIGLRLIVDDIDTHLANTAIAPIVQLKDDDIIPVIKNGEFTGDYLSRTCPNHLTPTFYIDNHNYYVLDAVPIDQPNKDDYPFYYIVLDEKYYLVPGHNNAQAIHFDFGNAFGDDRLFRKFDQYIHMNQFYNLLRCAPFINNPPPYLDKVIKPLLGFEFFKILALFSIIDSNEIKNECIRLINQRKPEFTKAVTLQFASRIGAPIDKNTSLDAQLNALACFFHACFTGRQQHAKQLFIEYFCNCELDVQVKLLNQYYYNVNTVDEDQGMALFFKSFGQTGLPNAAMATQFFTALTAIADLKLAENCFSQDANYQLIQLKHKLHVKLCQDFTECKLQLSFDPMMAIIGDTKHIIAQFTQIMNQLPIASNLKSSYILSNIIALNKTITNSNKLSNKQLIIIAASTLLGTLIGIVIGALLGFMLGVAVGAGVGLVIPVVGSVFASIASCSMGGVVVAMKAGGIGGIVGAAIGIFLVGLSMAYIGDKVSYHASLGSDGSRVDALAESLATHASMARSNRFFNDVKQAFPCDSTDEFDADIAIKN